MDQEKQTSVESISDLYETLLEFEPKLVTNFVPKNAAEQKGLFLSGEVRNPNHEYDRLDDVNFSSMSSKINQTGLAILNNENLDPKHINVYEEYITRYNKMLRLMELAYLFNHADDKDEESKYRQEYMDLGIELYSEPSETTYRSLLQEKLDQINKISLDESALKLKKELFSMVDYIPGGEKIKRFTPSADTVEWVHGVTESLYNGMLCQIPNQEAFTATEVKLIFTDIIKNEFGEAAEGWKVDVEKAQSIDVKTDEKRIVIPIDRADVSHEKLQGLVVHEIGVHVLRSIMGAETNMLPLRNGLSDYLDSEEGIAVVMENALKSKFVESGVDPYIIAGLIYCDKKDFRDTFEVKWRMNALGLNSVKKSGKVSDDDIVKAKNGAYGGVMRFMRGTDELPWFKDLTYYNGAVNMWKYLEGIRGDDIMFMFLLDGKADPSSIVHRRHVLEVRTE